MFGAFFVFVDGKTGVFVNETAIKTLYFYAIAVCLGEDFGGSSCRAWQFPEIFWDGAGQWVAVPVVGLGLLG